MVVKPAETLLRTMTESRTTRPLIGVFEQLSQDTGAGVGLQSGEDTGIDVGFVYSTQAACEFATDGNEQAMLIDLNFVDTTLEFVSALEIQDERASTSAAMMTFYRGMLETALEAPESPVFHGLLCDYVVSSATSATHFNKSRRTEANLGRAEYVTRLAAVHEMAHGRLGVDSEFTAMQIARFEAEVRHTLVHGEKVKADSGDDLAYRAATQAKAELDRYRDTGSIPHALEELLCDHAMVNAASDAIVATDRRIEKLDTYVALTSATLAMVWILPTLKRSTRTLLEISEEIDLSPGAARDVRNVLAMLTFLRRTGAFLKRALGKDEGESAIIRHWNETADYERVAVQLMNAIFDEANITRLLLIGTSAVEHGVTSIASARVAALNTLGWR